MWLEQQNVTMIRLEIVGETGEFFLFSKKKYLSSLIICVLCMDTPVRGHVTTFL